MPPKLKPNRYGRMLQRLIDGRRLTQKAFVARVRETAGTRVVSQPHLSLVLAGKAPVPLGWCPIIADTFGLTAEQRKRFATAAAFDHGLDIDIPPLPK